MITECHKSSDKLGESVAQIRAKLNEVIRALNNKEAHPRADNNASAPLKPCKDCLYYGSTTGIGSDGPCDNCRTDKFEQRT